ncbi:hypothetical protein GGD63_003759 [Bradyrhizobium sp. cir1]|uniref:hypothetical protein n=1 Tax=Bradyrhizobium sp. cir1 TaxID=1445730 RepID=UPI00160628CF|nr:hypothetical protein [Bradyrhizobium sp. cir1]MBB4370962.1 hypothetical protein [Bradyrhizobium sp. cir1]
MAEEFQRFVILNRLASISISRAPVAFKPPTVAGVELFNVLQERNEAGSAIEFFGAGDTEKDDEETEDERIARCVGHNFIWLRQIKIATSGAHRYAKLLLEFVDQSKKSFSVVDTSSLKGRNISGGKNERGGVSCHVVVRLPIKQHDDGDYRCAIEVAHTINRGMIETFLCRQLRRWAHNDELTYEVHLPDRKGKASIKVYKYSPRLELLADVGRSLSFATAGGRELAHMTSDLSAGQWRNGSNWQDPPGSRGSDGSGNVPKGTHVLGA